MAPILIVLTVVGYQSAVGAGPGDPLMRPTIPNRDLIRDDWVQLDLGISPHLATRLANEWRTPGKGSDLRLFVKQWEAPKLTANSLNEQYAKRLIQLSLWTNDIFSLNNLWAQSQLGLTPTQRKQVDGYARGYYAWCQGESKRLNSSTSSKRHLPNQMETLRRIVKARSAMRRVLTLEQAAKLRTLRGRAPHTFQPFGFVWANPSAHVYPTSEQLFGLARVHEELGFTMKQSRQLTERLQAAGRDFGKLLPGVYAGLDSMQKRRFRELERQYVGPGILLYHDARDEIGVDADRMDQAYVRLTLLAADENALQNQGQVEIQALEKKRSLDQDALNRISSKYDAKRRALARAKEAAILGALSPEQRVRWYKMLGKIVPNMRPAWMN